MINGGCVGYFNSQPREGGWSSNNQSIKKRPNFNSQPREGGWAAHAGIAHLDNISTHSRAKAAGFGRF